MTTTTTVIDQLLSPAESLFHDNRRAGHTYSLTLDKLVALGAMYDTSATSPPGR